MTDTHPAMQVRCMGHGLFSILILGIYGGQVCPLIEGLSMPRWFGELILIFAAFLILRRLLLNRYVMSRPFRKQAAAQFYSELILYLMIGVTLSMTNSWLHGFPNLESGSKIIIGTAALGFFTAIDMALARERIIHRELEQTRYGFEPEKRFFPITRKFAIAAVVISMTVAIITVLVIFKDLDWMTGPEMIDPSAGKQAVLIEILFITGVFLGHVCNLIFSFSKNLKIAVGKENEALIEVSNGNLDCHVAVSTNDEFGVMAHYTNIMIEKLHTSNQEIQQTRDVTIMALASLAETRDNETGAHLLRTQNYIRALALCLSRRDRYRSRLDDAAVDLLYKSAPLHDIGKVGIPDSILLKPGKLTDDEFAIMKKHTIYGKSALEKAARDLTDNHFLQFAQEIAFSHHEKWDGSGYPLGLRGKAIPLSGRLMAVADVYDALISRRVYKPAFTHEKSREIILKGRGTHFDPDIVDAFITVEDQFISIAETYSDH